MRFSKSLWQIKQPEIFELGGKGYSLAVLVNNGFNVPKGFVITTDTFFEYLRQNSLMNKIKNLVSKIEEMNFQGKNKEIKHLISNGNMTDEIRFDIKKNLTDLNVQYVVVRSSGISEDSSKASFAGIYDTFLNVRANIKSVSGKVVRCWASLFSERAVIYRLKKEIPHLEGMAIIIQEMIPAVISGITFTTHPVDKKNLLIETSYGIGNMIVTGKVEPDSYVITRNILKIVRKRIGKKYKMSKAGREEIKIVNVENEFIGKQVLSDNMIKDIAQICLNIEEIFHYPQDIEWCIYNRKLWLLQSRAITGRCSQ